MHLRSRLLLALGFLLTAWLLAGRPAGVSFGQKKVSEKKTEIIDEPVETKKEETKKEEFKKGEPKSSRSPDEQLLDADNIPTDPASLLKFFKGRTLSEDEQTKIHELIKHLGAPTYREREKAMHDLIQRGPVVVKILQSTLPHPDLEINRRLHRAIDRIQSKDVSIDVPGAAARLLAKAKPKETVETLLSYLPFADNDLIGDEVRDTLTVTGLVDGKPHPALVEAIKDTQPLRRASAAEVLTRLKSKEHKDTIRGLLQDPEPSVRLRVGIALVYAQDRSAVPVLIDSLPQFTLQQAWQAEDVLFRLAEEKSPPAVSLGADEASRRKCRDAWRDWWKTHESKISLANLTQTPTLKGYTIVVLLDMGRVMELDEKNQPRWEIEGLVFPLDVQMTREETVLVAEYHAGRVTERDTKGRIVWQHEIGAPLAAQRLPNGNTFISTDSMFLEVDRAGKEIYNVSAKDGERFMKACKTHAGDIVCLTSEQRIVRFNSEGKEMSSFNITLSVRLFGGRIHVQPSGRILVPHNGENKVVEYDPSGKILWEAAIDSPVAAVRLPNGNTLVTTMLPTRGAIELNRNGEEVWSYRANTRVTRALRR